VGVFNGSSLPEEDGERAMPPKVCLLNHVGVSSDLAGVATCFAFEEVLRRRLGEETHIERIHRRTPGLFSPPNAAEDFEASLRRLRRNAALADVLRAADLVVLNADEVFMCPDGAARAWPWLAAVHAAKHDFKKPAWVVNAALPGEEGDLPESVVSVLSEVDHLAVRNAAGFERAERLALRRAQRCADLVFLTGTRFAPDVERYLGGKYGFWREQAGGRRILIAGSRAITAASLARWRLAYSMLIEHLSENDPAPRVLFLASSDAGLDAAVAAYLKVCFDNVTVVSEDPAPADASWLICRADLVVSGCFCVNALAALAGTPALFVAGDTSVHASLQRADDASVHILSDIGDTESLLSRCDALMSGGRTALEEQARRRAEWRRQAMNNFPPPHIEGEAAEREVDSTEYLRQAEFVLSCAHATQLALRDEVRARKESLEFHENRVAELEAKIEDLTLERDKFRERSEALEGSRAYKMGRAMRSAAHVLLPWLARKARRETAARRERRLKRQQALAERRGPDITAKRFQPAEIKVLHFSSTPLAGSPVRVSRVLNRSPEISSICVSRKAAYYDGRRFPCDIEYNDRSEDEVRRHVEELIAEADVLHFHNESYWNLPAVFAKWIGRKPCCVQWHSGPDEIGHRLGMTVEEVSRWNDVPVLVIAQKQARFYPHAIPVPNAVPLGEAPYQPHPRDTGRLHIAFTPAEDVLPWSRLCRDKGMSDILAALDTIRKRHGDAAEVHVVQGVPLDECLRIKRRCHVCIDDIKSGGYHLSSLEGLAMGCVTIANLDAEMRAFLAAYTGCPERDLPWFPASPDNLLERLETLIEDRRLVEKTGLMSRIWMETYWNEAFVVRKFREAYRKILDRS